MENKTLQNMDGCTAATYIAYALSEVATIYPITPIASMGEVADKWAMGDRKNLFGSTMEIREMESELGAAGATHGALAAGAFATTFTSSQGLMLMIPNMYKIAGEQLPGVFHVGCRSLASHALSIFGDHQDVMACRATGFVMLSSSSVQETMDLALVSHLAAIEGSLPVLHFFDGWRTSNETTTVEPIPYSAIAPLVNWEKVKQFRKRALNPEHPTLRGTSQGPDVYFQCREASNPAYNAMPAIMQQTMDKVSAITGRSYHLVDYYGAPDADRIIVSIGSSTQVIASTVDWLNKHNYRTGLINVRLYRPFPAKEFMAAIPQTVKAIAVLDRTKEPGAPGEPLFTDVAATVQWSGRDIKVTGGRYGLSSKEFNPVMVKAVFDELALPNPRRQFTVGITDDVTNLSLDISGSHFIEPEPDVTQTIFYGIGADGTVSATRQLANIITDVTGMYTQAYFNYSAKKSGGYTISQLRYAPHPIRAEYEIENADYVGCNKDVYVKRFHMLDALKPGGMFVLNSAWTLSDMEREFPARLKRCIAQKNVRFYNVDAINIAKTNGLGVRINSIMAAVYLHLMAQHLPINTTIDALKEQVKTAYMHEGGDVVARNIAAIDAAAAAIKEISYPSSWAGAVDNEPTATQSIPEFIKDVAKPCLDLLGNELPVSAFAADGSLPMGTAAYEKRRIAVDIPAWDSQKCIQCTQCSFVCPHAAIRPFLLDADEQKSVPEGMDTVDTKMSQLKGLKYRIQVFPADCLGCGSCAVICPGHALTMVPIDTIFKPQAEYLDWIQNNVTYKPDLLPRFTIQGSQLHQPLFEFSGACAGCGETPYLKLLTQLFGERMVIANATGCSSIYGATFPSNPYCTNSNGHGPAWANSLFEDNAEYGFGMACAISKRRDGLKANVAALASDSTIDSGITEAAKQWLAAYDSATDSASTGQKLKALLGQVKGNELVDKILADADLLTKKSVWAVGGDGWAYDIDFGGLDHVLAQDTDINVLVMDTECYSNTGGQTSKATPLGACVKYAADGKRTYKKDLGRMMMTYGNVYVASIALGANYLQAIKALQEAESYPGPSIIIAYCPCINHGIRTGMGHTIVEEKLAVKTGYWQLYRYNPANQQPLTVDAPAPDGNLITFINGEDRYADLKMVDPNEASILQPKLKERAELIYSILKNLTENGTSK
ncbi:MAG: pyruvate:ferredoxin (flavodoxin) oxidoreductase [Firmicutes bacterium]|nr:pyruvate:ferredoxin (flavodoxin) oxidoreductase [Bacillota bacterium]MCM1477549.1 pyruvate:ferredoxin (flavodoxin) oxidoreductase [Bacteroides sp.]